jgi:RNA polymerase sigma-70 factor (ECF subfamily)
VLSVADAVPLEAWNPSVSAFVERLRALDDAAWREFYDQSYRKMYNYAYVRCGDPEMAEDVASDVFAAAVKGISHFRYTGAPLNAWLYRIARSVTADHLKRRRSRPTVAIDDVEVVEDSWSPAADDRRDLSDAISRLKPEHQEVLHLVFQEGMTPSEAAEVMRKRPGTVRVLQHRALAALRRQLEEPKPGRKR